MKKLMVAFVAIAMAMAANASAFKWSTAMGGNVYLPGTTTALASATAYLFDADVVSQASLVEKFADSKGSLSLSSLTSLSNAAVATGKISGTTFDWGSEGDFLNTYFAVIATVEGENVLYVSSFKADQPAQSVGKTTLLSFNEKTASQLASMDANNGYSSAGWYAVTPEPTSGLLILLGLGVLALRRKQA